MIDSEVPKTLRIRFSIVTINIIFGFLGKKGNIISRQPGLLLLRPDDIQLPVLALLSLLRPLHRSH